MENLAKPTGIMLADHTRHVRDETRAILASRPFLIYKYAARTGHNLIALADTCARWHDEGKLHPDWQGPCQLDFAEYLRVGKSFRAIHLQKGKVRHEFESLVQMRKAFGTGWLPKSVHAAIAAHHGKLGIRHERRWKAYPSFEQLWFQEFKPLAAELDPTDAGAFEQAIARRYEYAGLRALLRLADRRASAIEDADKKNPTPAVPKLRSFRYKFDHPEQRGIQKLIPHLWDEPFALLRAPTGAGKTDAALIWARRQVLTGRADRLVWAMPTRFTANSLAIATTESLGHAGLYHSSAWSQAQKQQSQGGSNGLASWRQELDYARLLETAATVTTIDQLCLCLTATREDHHATFWNLSHSCVVIDEADFYDDFTQQNLVVLLRALRLLQVPVLLMSATLPQSSLALYSKSGFQPKKIFEAENPVEDNRTRLRLTRAGASEFPNEVGDLLQRGLTGEPLIVYANTVGRAQAYWDWYRQHGMATDDLVLYHSRFTEPDKEAIEQKLLAMLGPEAWKNGTAHGVAILTQIGELSVNISADLMISDVCPTDRLAQRAGRLSRFQLRADGRMNVAGELHLVEPQKTDKHGITAFYPAPYGHYKKGDGWIMSEALKQSNEQLQSGDYSARRFVNLVNDLYPDVPAESTRIQNNRDALEDALIRNWLIVPASEAELDDADTAHWRSRDIPPQKIVYANTDFSALLGEGDSQFFSSSFSFREWALLRSISISVYDFERAKSDGKMDDQTILVGDEKEIIWIVRKTFYSSQTGLRFDAAPSEEDE